jgi:homeobox protein cut-like
MQLAERQLRESQHTCASLKSEVGQLQQDNLTLYQKIRYLQSFSYRSNHPSGVHGGETLGLMEEGRSSAIEGKYRTAYESRISPFAQFSHTEKQRK